MRAVCYALGLVLASVAGDDMFSKANCGGYNDDAVFTADVCSTFDDAICFAGTDTIKTPCNATFWCRELCGAMCGENGGALCFYSRLNHLQHTCGVVSAILEHSGYDPGANETARLGDTTPATTVNGPGTTSGMWHGTWRCTRSLLAVLTEPWHCWSER